MHTSERSKSSGASGRWIVGRRGFGRGRQRLPLPLCGRAGQGGHGARPGGRTPALGGADEPLGSPGGGRGDGGRSLRASRRPELQPSSLQAAFTATFRASLPRRPGGWGRQSPRRGAGRQAVPAEGAVTGSRGGSGAAGGLRPRGRPGGGPWGAAGAGCLAGPPRPLPRAPPELRQPPRPAGGVVRTRARRPGVARPRAVSLREVIGARWATRASRGERWRALSPAAGDWRKCLPIFYFFLLCKLIEELLEISLLPPRFCFRV